MDSERTRRGLEGLAKALGMSTDEVCDRLAREVAAMSDREARAHNTGVRRVLGLVRELAGMLSESDHAETERTKGMVEALRAVAQEGGGMLIPEADAEAEADDV